MSAHELFQLGLAELAGAALLLDRELRIVGATPRARELLGPLTEGERAPNVLCGHATDRPIAEALAAGRPTRGVVVRPTAEGERRIRVRTLLLGDRGWLVLLEDEGVTAAGPECFHGMWSQDPAMKHVFRLVERVARSEASVLVRGETGTGKELVAQAIHALSRRSAGPFRAINCAALPATLLESELFGHVRGAFTGAVRDTPGHFEAARGGTIFLDEVAEIPLELQAKLLRVVQTHTVIPVGGREPVPVDVRIVTATHRALREEVRAGRFRADLMYRLRVVPIFLPPLRARRGDVPLLTRRFVASMNERGGRVIEHVADEAMQALEAYSWPGNVRELMNVLEYAYAVGDGPVLVSADLPLEVLDPASTLAESVPQINAPPDTETPEAQRIRRALERAAGNRTRAAHTLGVSRTTLWRRMKELGLLDEREARRGGRRGCVKSA